MRNRLLPMLGLFCMAFTANAQDKAWDRPSPQRAKFVDAPENGKLYLLYNTDAAQFMCNGLNWNTRTCVAPGMANMYLLETKQVINRATGRARKGTGGWTMTTKSFSDPEGSRIVDKYVFIDAPDASYQDMGSQGHNYFDFVANGDGTYRLRAVASDANYGQKAAGWDYDNMFFGVLKPETEYVPEFDEYTAVNPNGKAETHFINWKFAEADLYGALIDLYNALEKNDAAAEDTKVEADDIVAAYNDENATVESLKAALDLLNKRIKEKPYAMLQGATPENPVEITSLLENPSFDGNANGWNITFQGGKNANNVGYQGANYTNGDVKIERFMEAWANQSYRDGITYRCLGDGEMSQTLTDMPAGKYMLTVDCIANQQDGYSTPCTGVELFCQGGEFIEVTTLATGNDAPEHFEVNFLSGGGDLTVGLRTKDCTANWIAADNFRLYFKGFIGEDENPAKLLLDSAIDGYAKYDEETGDYEEFVANKEVIEAWEEALAAAKAATSNYDEAKAALIAAADALKASIADYEHLKAVLDLCDKKSEILNEAGFTNVEETLGELHDILADAYADGTYTSEDIAKVEDMLVDAVNEGVSGGVEPGMDVTVLLDNPGFDTDFSGWTVVSGSTPGWGGNGIWEGTEIPNSVEGGLQPAQMGSGNAEKWHAAFDICQTIKGMPAGIYTLSCQAFERSDDGNPFAAVLYAVINGKEQSVPVKDLYSETAPQRLFDVDDSNEKAWQKDSQYGDGYVPNGMSGANVYFAQGYYKNKFVFIVDEPTDITVGIKTASDKNWILFDDFHIVFEGMTADPLREVLETLIETAQTTLDASIQETTSSTPAQAEIQTALETAVGKVELETAEELQAAYNELSEAYKTFQSNIAAMASFADKYTTFSEAADSLYLLPYDGSEVYVEDASLIAEADKILAMFDNQTYFDATTAELEATNAAADSLVTEMLKWVDFKNYAASWLKTAKSYAIDVEDDALSAKYEAEKAALEGKSYTKVTGELAAYKDELKAILDEMTVWNTYAESKKRELPEGWENASDENLYEFTEYVMKNADLNKGADKDWAWVKEAQNGPTKDGVIDGTPCLEFWNPTAAGNHFDYHQTLFGLPAGRYMLWVTGMVAKNGEEVEKQGTGRAELYAHVQNGAAESNHNTPVKYIEEDPSAELASTGDYDYCVYFEVPEAAADAPRGVEVTVGVRTVGNMPGRWFVADDFQLIYYGKNSSKPETPDAIEAVAGAAKSSVIYNAAGMKQTRLQRGLNIIETTREDGTKVTTKVMLK